MKKNVFLTGATGTMGWAGFQELLGRADRFNITLLVRPSRRNRRLLRPYAGLERVRIVWGDLTSYDDVASCVAGADYVLHAGGMVSPKADPLPATTRRVNISAAENIIRAVRARPSSDDIKVVYIGSVAQTGDRNPPLHWGRTGDPINISIYDHYAATKAEAELIFAESGLRHWVSLRQSAILYPGILRNFNPVMFHVPLAGVLEWTTVEDSGRLLANVCEDWVPESFWRNFYNIGSGREFRLTNYEFECLTLSAAGCPPPEKLFAPRWFATRNFHGHWFEDSDRLEQILHFRENIGCKEYFARMKERLPGYMSLTPLVPARIIRFFIKRLAQSKPFGTLHWIDDGVQDRIAAHIGSTERWKQTPDWNEMHMQRPSEQPVRLEHGYDESKEFDSLTIADMRQAAQFRGGECISSDMNDTCAPLQWRCRQGHTFHLSPRSVLLGGHWCPDCQPIPGPWDYDVIARGNPFFAQVWTPFHKGENNRYEASALDSLQRGQGS